MNTRVEKRRACIIDEKVLYQTFGQLLCGKHSSILYKIPCIADASKQLPCPLSHPCVIFYEEANVAFTTIAPCQVVIFSPKKSTMATSPAPAPQPFSSAPYLSAPSLSSQHPPAPPPSPPPPSSSESPSLAAGALLCDGTPARCYRTSTNGIDPRRGALQRLSCSCACGQQTEEMKRQGARRCRFRRRCSRLVVLCSLSCVMVPRVSRSSR